MRWLFHLGTAGALLLALACTAGPADKTPVVDGAKLGPQEKKPATERKKDRASGAKRPAKGATQSAPEKALKEYKKEQSLLEEKKKSLAATEIAIGKQHMQRQDWVEAEKAFRKAYELDPSSEEAQSLLFRVESILGKREGQLKDALERLGSERKVRERQMVVELDLLEADAGALYDKGEFEKAAKLYQRVEATLAVGGDWIPDSTGRIRRVRSKIAECKRLQKEQELYTRERLTDTARQAAEADEERRRRRLEEKVDYLLDLAIEKMKAQRYDKAMRLIDDVLEIEPQHPLAMALQEQARKGDLLHQEWVSIHRTNEYLVQDRENTMEAGIPYTDIVRFPPKDKWLDVARRVLGTGAATRDEDPEIKRMREILNTRKVTINFEETPLDHVVSFLHDITGLNIQISPQIDPTDVTVTLDLKEALLVNALKLIMEKVELTYSFREEVIYISEAGEEEGELIFDIYNVQDILNKIEDFVGPEIKVHSQDAPQPGTGGGAGQLVFGDDDDADLEGTIDPEKLLDLIQNSTGEDNWEIEGASIEHHRGQLLVNNTREVHLEIQKVLENLRKDAGLFVVVEARFIDLFDDFLSEIGIDYRGLPTAPIGNSTGILAPNQSGGTDTGAERTLGSNVDNSIMRLQNIFDGFSGFLAGRRLTGGTLPGRDMPGLSIQSTWIEPFQVNAILRARQEHNRVQLLSAPVITAANRQRVYISAITQRAYIADYDLASGGTGFVAVEIADPIIQTFEEGVILDVRPTISSDRRYVTLDAKPTLAQLVGGFISTILVDLGSINQAATQVPIGIPEISLQEAFTSVTIPDGGTALLGGFRSLNERYMKSSVPIFDSIPVFNVLWSRKGEISEKRSLVILITARVVILRDLEKDLFSTQ